MRKTSSDFKTFFISEPGSFRDNKDYFGFMELDDTAIWIAADGLDSDEERESAEIVAQSIFEDFLECPTLSRIKLKRYLLKAHRKLQNESRSVRLKASLVMVVTDYSKMVWALSGNARLYHFRQYRLNLKSKDQSIAQLMAESGRITDDEVNEHEEHNNLINYFGIQKRFKPILSRPVFLNDGDIIILCTAGFWENINNIEMIDALKNAEEPEALMDILEELMLEKQNEVLNNYTIATVFVEKTFKDNAESKAKKTKKTLIVAAAVVVAVLILGLVTVFAGRQIQAAKTKQINNLKIIANIDNSEIEGDEFFKEAEYQQALKAYDGAVSGINLIKESARDKVKESRLGEKYELTKSMVAADELFNGKSYQQALTGYLEADQKAAALKYDRQGIKQRINKANSYILVLQLVAEGDSAFDQKDYQIAKEKYIKANTIANKVSFQEMSRVLEMKLNDSSSKKNKLASAKQFRKQGDQNYQAHKYKEAIGFYNMAKSVYEELGATKELMALENRLQDSEKFYQRYEEGQNYEKQGDEQSNTKKYKKAIPLYNLARRIYSDLKMDHEVKRLDKKIAETEDLCRWWRKD